MFYNCTSLVNAPELPAATLADGCYQSMFSYCSSLTEAPELPATTLARGCYGSMFNGCTKLTQAPELPATELVEYCYGSMFSSCSSLTEAPELPATTLAQNCYNSMFYRCTSLTQAPELPATTLASYCYREMFYGCSNLNYVKMVATANATNAITDWLYGVSQTGTFIKHPDNNWIPTGISGIPEGWNVMDSIFFNYMTIEALENGLTVSFTNNLEYNIDEINWIQLDANITTPSINKGDKIAFRANLTPNSSSGIGTFTISKKCNLMGNCMSLLFGDDAANNNSLEGYDDVFSGLFGENENIVNVDKNFLPATTLSEWCYGSMFANCTSLATAPELPATTLAEYCYESMFFGCTSLAEAPELPATGLAEGCYSYMFSECTSLTEAPELPATELAVYCYDSMFDECTSLTRAPELPATELAEECYYGMFNNCYYLNYVKMLATTEATDALKNWMNGVSPTGTFIKHPDNNWIPTGSSGIPEGWNVMDSIFFNYMTIEALENGLTVSFTNNLEYSIDGTIWNTLSANTTSPAINKGNKILFRANLTPNSSSGIGAFSITKKCNLKGNCMSLLFGDDAKDNTDLTGKNYAFYKLFKDCTNIINVDANFLPATELADNCYRSMFSDCTLLATAPELPATKLVPSCYQYMFVSCKSLTQAPKLPVIELADNCYNGMFANCSSLITAPELPATTLANGCYDGMFQNCTSLATAPELPATELVYNCYYYMFYGCTSLTTAPELSATKLTERCYMYMFKDCSNLNYVKMLATTNASNALVSWLNGVKSTGTFVKHPDNNWIPTGVNGIPSGWTVETATS